MTLIYDIKTMKHRLMIWNILKTALSAIWKNKRVMTDMPNCIPKFHPKSFGM